MTATVRMRASGACRAQPPDFCSVECCMLLSMVLPWVDCVDFYLHSLSPLCQWPHVGVIGGDGGGPFAPIFRTACNIIAQIPQDFVADTRCGGLTWLRTATIDRASDTSGPCAIPIAACPQSRRRSDETHLSTLEPGSQTPPRVPRAHGHQGRPQDPECTSCTWPQVAERVSASTL